jgi:uncharacterized protein DUF4124
MRYRSLLLALYGALGCAGIAHSASPSHGAPSSADSALRVFKWTDNKGIVHYGDSVPAEYAQSDRSVLNGQGVELSHSPGQRSAAELSAEEQTAREAAQRAQHDRFLLATYASEQEIEQLRDERLDQITGQIKASSSYIDSLGSRLAALQERAMHFAPYSSDPDARRMPDELAEELVRTVNESRSQRAALETKRREEVDMRAQFETDLERYRELTAARH